MPSLGRMRERLMITQENIYGKTNYGSYGVYDPTDRLLATFVVGQGGTYRSKSYQRTWDQINPRNKDGIYLAGGKFASYHAVLNDALRHPFTLSSKGYEHPNLPVGYYRVYNVIVTNPIFSFDPTQPSLYEKIGDVKEGYWDGGVSSVDGYDALAWSRTKPKLEKGGLGVAIAELRDLPGMLATSFKPIAKGFASAYKGSIPFKKFDLGNDARMHKDAADHFLNHQFGWVPFLSDLEKLFDNFEHSKEYIAQITRDNNQWVKRKRVLEKSNTSRELGASPTAGCDPIELTNFCRQVSFRGSPAYAYHITSEHVIDTVWAVGSFKYYRPEFDNTLPDYSGLVNQAKQALILHGARVNPSFLYKITPWTWLGDWFTGVGTVVDNASSIYEDSIVSRYLYVMKHTLKQIEQSSTFNFISGARTFTWLRIIDVKQRKTSDSPYGFALPGDLNAKQLAVLVALGISRTP